MTDQLLIGQRGSGKTLRMVRNLLLGIRSGYSAVTNLKLIGVPFIPFKIQTIYDAMRNDLDLNQIYRSEKIVMGLDEITTLGDSRTSLKTENIVLSYLFMQARKRHINILGTLQDIEDLDKRPRRLAQWRVECRCEGTEKDPIAFIYAYQNRANPRLKFAKRWPAVKASAFYPFYKTDQPINPQFLKTSK